MRKFFRSEAAGSRIRPALVVKLYDQPSSLIVGALCGISASAIAGYQSHNGWITFSATIFGLIAMGRIAAALFLPRMIPMAMRKLDLAHQTGAFAYALMAGIIAAQTILLDVDAAVRTLMVANATAYSVGIAARNAARPILAIGQLTLALTPVIIAGAIQEDPASRFLALTLCLLIPAMLSITVKVFRALRDSISTAETSQRLAEKMQHLARTDIVTGLLNRAGLNHALIEQAVSIGPESRLAVLWLDLDRFKEVNDTLGHQVGDRLLIEVASRLRRKAPKDACIARFGGDEFILAFEVASGEEAEDTACSILAEIRRPVRIEDDRIEISCSIGVALMSEDGNEIETVLRAADLALNHAKIGGRKQVVRFVAAMTHDLVRRKEIESDLRQALLMDELSIYFQPVVDLTTGRIRAFEALVRWFHPEKGELRPDEFIPVAEETGAIITLGNWITAKAARIAAQWPEGITLAVNLSPVQMRAPGAALGILAALREAGLPPHRLELEITETVLLDHNPRTEGFIEELTNAGIRFALDDFGTGYSSLGYLDKYRFSKIKIDRSFVSRMAQSTSSEAIIRAVSSMGRSLDMEIVAEGLETLEQVRAVRDAGCTLGQGWYFSRAVPDYMVAMLLAQEAMRFGDVSVSAAKPNATPTAQRQSA